MKKILCVGIALFLLNCKNGSIENTQKVVYYPSKRFFGAAHLKEVKIGANDDYLNIVGRVDRIHRSDSLPFLEFEEGNRSVKLIPLRNYGLYNESNRIRISEDSTYLAFEGNPHKELDQLLIKHYENNGREPRLSENPQKAVVEIELDHFDKGEKLLKLLKMVTRSFERLNTQHGNSLELKVVLGLPVPPPPPSSPTIKN